MNWKRELKITPKQYNESVLPTRIRFTQCYELIDGLVKLLADAFGERLLI